jgi:SHS family lactate transporter-like MFS transporter
LAVALFRAALPESEVFLRAREEARAKGHLLSEKEKTKVFLHETGAMLRKHWILCIYAVLLMTGFNFLSHGSQDLYPTFMKTSKGFSNYDATVATIIGNCGAIAGGIIAGWLSQRLGRRLTIIAFTLSIGAFIPLWILPSSFSALAAGAFFLQVGVQGAWGIIPIHLNELSPSGFRSTFPGVAYQLGNMISSAASQIEATAGDHIQTTIYDRTTGKYAIVPDYGKVQGILIGVVAAFVIFMTVIGTENRGRHFEQAKLPIEEGASAEDLAVRDVERGGSEEENEKPAVANIEDVMPVDEKRA